MGRLRKAGAGISVLPVLSFRILDPDDVQRPGQSPSSLPTDSVLAILLPQLRFTGDPQSIPAALLDKQEGESESQLRVSARILLLSISCHVFCTSVLFVGDFTV